MILIDKLITELTIDIVVKLSLLLLEEQTLDGPLDKLD